MPRTGRASALERLDDDGFGIDGAMELADAAAGAAVGFHLDVAVGVDSDGAFADVIGSVPDS